MRSCWWKIPRLWFDGKTIDERANEPLTFIQPVFPRLAANELMTSPQEIRRRTSDMKRAAIGVRMHSGWGALVAVTNNAGTVEIIERRRVAVIIPGTPGAKQPYHFAENLELPEAEKFLGTCFAASRRLASAAVRDVVGDLGGRQYRVVGSAVILASGRPLPALANILAAHPLMHAEKANSFAKFLRKHARALTLR